MTWKGTLSDVNSLWQLLAARACFVASTQQPRIGATLQQSAGMKARRWPPCRSSGSPRRDEGLPPPTCSCWNRRRRGQARCGVAIWAWSAPLSSCMWLLSMTTHSAARRSRPFHADLAPVALGEDPYPGGQFGRHVQDHLTVGHQALGQEPPWPRGNPRGPMALPPAFDRHIAGRVVRRVARRAGVNKPIGPYFFALGRGEGFGLSARDRRFTGSSVSVVPG